MYRYDEVSASAGRPPTRVAPHPACFRAPLARHGGGAALLVETGRAESAGAALAQRGRQLGLGDWRPRPCPSHPGAPTRSAPGPRFTSSVRGHVSAPLSAGAVPSPLAGADPGGEAGLGPSRFPAGTHRDGFRAKFTN